MKIICLVVLHPKNPIPQIYKFFYSSPNEVSLTLQAVVCFVLSSFSRGYGTGKVSKAGRGQGGHGHGVVSFLATG
jgi:hypothetical protein